MQRQVTVECYSMIFVSKNSLQHEIYFEWHAYLKYVVVKQRRVSTVILSYSFQTLYLEWEKVGKLQRKFTTPHAPLLHRDETTVTFQNKIIMRGGEVTLSITHLNQKPEVLFLVSKRWDIKIMTHLKQDRRRVANISASMLGRAADRLI